MVEGSQLFLILLLLGFYDQGMEAGRGYKVAQQSRNSCGNAHTFPTVHI